MGTSTKLCSASCKSLSTLSSAKPSPVNGLQQPGPARRRRPSLMWVVCDFVWCGWCAGNPCLLCLRPCSWLQEAGSVTLGDLGETDGWSALPCPRMTSLCMPATPLSADPCLHLHSRDRGGRRTRSAHFFVTLRGHPGSHNLSVSRRLGKKTHYTVIVNERDHRRPGSVRR